MRFLLAGFALLFASASFAQETLAMPPVDVVADRVQRVPPLALTLEPQTFGCNIAIPPQAADPSDPPPFVSGGFAGYANVESLEHLAPLASLSVGLTGGVAFHLVGAPIRAWPHLQHAQGVWLATC